MKKETLRERFISSELKHKVTDELGLTKENYWLFNINITIMTMLLIFQLIAIVVFHSNLNSQ